MAKLDMCYIVLIILLGVIQIQINTIFQQSFYHKVQVLKPCKGNLISEFTLDCEERSQEYYI